MAQGRFGSRINRDEYIGKKNNQLTVIDIKEYPNHKPRTFLICQCSCGNTVEITPFAFNSGHNKSCGCARHGVIKHGLSSHPLYHEYIGMINRCYNPSTTNYERYGARGITVCDEWKNSPKAFFDWVDSVGGKPEGKTLDRIDNNKGYSPTNCRWSNLEEQQQNRRNSIIITINGETKTLAYWCRLYGLNHETARKRINNGWNPIDAVTTPSKAKK